MKADSTEAMRILYTQPVFYLEEEKTTPKKFPPNTKIKPQG